MVLTSTGTGQQSGRRPISAKWLVVTLAALLLVAGGGAYVLLSGKADTKSAAARDAASSYLSAWSKADYATMAEHASVPAAELQYILAPIRDSLKVQSQSYESGDLKRTKLTATVPFRAALTLTGLGVWKYDGNLQLARGADKVWRVQFGPTAIHPQLGPGETITRSSVVGKRGKLLDRNGTPLGGEDADLDGNLIGSVGPLSAEQAAATGSNFVAGDVAGQSGLERAYNAKLAGDPGARIQITKDGKPRSTLQTYPAKPGVDIRTTVDLRYQRAGESGLSGLGRTAALVAIDAKTGGVLALVNHPSGSSSTAIQGQYAPGSTFKMVTTTAALLKGLNESSPLNCPAKVFAGGRSFKNSKNEAFGPIDLKQAFYHSCNTAFVNLRLQMNDADMQKAVQLYGFDGKPPLPIKSFGGTYPTGPDHDPYAEAFGQDQIESSPLQMAAIPAAIAGGTWHRPFVVGSAPESHPIPANVTSQMRDMMRAVVTEGTAAPVYFPGEVYGKTGTAEYGSAPGPGQDPPTHAWFAGFRGNVAFAVLVPGGGFGAEVAAPAASRFLSALDAGG